MSVSVTKKNKSSVFIEQITIIILLVALVTVGLFILYKSIIQEPTVSPNGREILQLSKIVEQNPGNQASRLLLAYAYQKDKDYAKAKAEYNNALKVNPDEIAALYNLGVIAIEEKKYDDAEKSLKHVLKLKDTHVLGALALGEVYIHKAKYDDAIKLGDRVLAIQPSLARPRILKAQALEKKGDKNGAKREYKEVLNYIPDHKEALDGLKRLK